MSGLSVGDHVRYRPGPDVYGYEDMVEADGTLPAQVMKFTDAGRVRLKVSSSLTRRTVERVVHLKSVEARSVMTSKEIPNEMPKGSMMTPKQMVDMMQKGGKKMPTPEKKG